MKKLIPVLIVALLAAFAVPALAGDGNLEWTATKTIDLTEDMHYTQDVQFFASGTFVFTGEAWAKIQEQQELYDNFSLESGSTRISRIAGSFNLVDGNGATGVVNLNQSPGNLNSQANEVAISVGSAGFEAIPPTAGEGEAVFKGLYAEAQVVSVQYIGVLATKETDTIDDTTLTAIQREEAGNFLQTNGLIRADTLFDSFNGFFGVADVNQASGVLNNQGNAVAIAAGLDQRIVKAATQVMMSQVTAHNQLFDQDFAHSSAIGGCFNDAHGVGNVNQASGHMNNQKNIVALGFSHPSQ